MPSNDAAAPSKHWSTEVLMVFANFLMTHYKLLAMERIGIHEKTDYVEIAEILIRTHERFGPAPGRPLLAPFEKDAFLADARSMEAFAREQEAADCSLLHCHGTVMLWSAVEVLTDDLAVSTITAKPKLLESDKWRRVRVPAAKVIALSSEEDRYTLIYAEALRSLDEASNSGIPALSKRLALVGLDGPFYPQLKRDMTELHAVRNVTAHRCGVADSKFIATCPWLGYSVGDTVKIDASTYMRLQRAAIDYGYTIVSRARALDGLSPLQYYNVMGEVPKDDRGAPAASP